MPAGSVYFRFCLFALAIGPVYRGDAGGIANGAPTQPLKNQKNGTDKVGLHNIFAGPPLHNSPVHGLHTIDIPGLYAFRTPLQLYDAGWLMAGCSNSVPTFDAMFQPGIQATPAVIVLFCRTFLAGPGVTSLKWQCKNGAIEAPETSRHET